MGFMHSFMLPQLQAVGLVRRSPAAFATSAPGPLPALARGGMGGCRGAGVGRRRAGRGAAPLGTGAELLDDSRGVLFDVRACGGPGVTWRARAGARHWTVPREREKRVHILRALLNPPIRRLTSWTQAVVTGHSWRTVQARTPRFRGVMGGGRTWRGRVGSQGEGRRLVPKPPSASSRPVPSAAAARS